MTTKIRLRREGRKKHPCYSVVVIDSRKRRDGEYIEKIGVYHPISKDESKKIIIEQERYEYWISKGAQPTERVEKIFKIVSNKEVQSIERPTKENG